MHVTHQKSKVTQTDLQPIRALLLSLNYPQLAVLVPRVSSPALLVHTMPDRAQLSGLRAVTMPALVRQVSGACIKLPPASPPRHC